MLRKGLLVLVISILLGGTLVACGSLGTTLDYGDAESFEAALNRGENLEGKTVAFEALELHPDSAFGYDVWAGEHLNFVSKRNPDIKAGDIITVKAKTVQSVLGSWIIEYEKVNAKTGDKTITSNKSTENLNGIDEIDESDNNIDRFCETLESGLDLSNSSSICMGGIKFYIPNEFGTLNKRKGDKNIVYFYPDTFGTRVAQLMISEQEVSKATSEDFWNGGGYEEFIEGFTKSLSGYMPDKERDIVIAGMRGRLFTWSCKLQGIELTMKVGVTFNDERESVVVVSFGDSYSQGKYIEKIENILGSAEKTDNENRTVEETTATATKTSGSESGNLSTSNQEYKGENGLGSDFKEAMDSYEAFFDEYVAFMKKYSKSTDPMGLMADYLDYMTQYSDMMQKMEAWESKDLNAEETAYYLEVVNRINKKLLEVAQ